MTNTQWLLAVTLAVALTFATTLVQGWLARRKQDPKRGRDVFAVTLAHGGREIQTIAVRADIWQDATSKAGRYLAANIYALRVTTGGITYRVSFKDGHGCLVPMAPTHSSESEG